MNSQTVHSLHYLWISLHPSCVINSCGQCYLDVMNYLHMKATCKPFYKQWNNLFIPAYSVILSIITCGFDCYYIVCDIYTWFMAFQWLSNSLKLLHATMFLVLLDKSIYIFDWSQPWPTYQPLSNALEIWKKPISLILLSTMQADSNSYTNLNLLFRRNLQFRRLQRGENTLIGPLHQWNIMFAYAQSTHGH